VTKQVSISGDWIDETVGLAGVLADVVYLELPSGPRIELIDYRVPKGGKSDDNQPNTPGLRHLAFRVTGIDAFTERLKKSGVTFQSEVKSVPDSQVTYIGGVRKRLVYYRDPEGNILELCEYK
jgi:catechol 2,3-dioxygenase-like lactoylglutathione lyase family enzyme